MGETRNRASLAGKTVLVTGGTGTIGSAIVRRLLDSDAAGIRIFSRDEHKQFELRQRLPADERLRFMIGDTRELSRLRRAVEGVAVIFHAAAMKHVLSCEYNPFEAVRTNVLGTQNVVDAALDADVEAVLFASSDKAVNPTSTMGVSKLMAEKLMTAADVFRGPHPAVFATVRFGNVIGSRGSVVPLFLEQISNGGPLTITDRRMTRFIMSIDRAVNLMFDALALARGAEVFVLKMPALRIEDLASLLRENVSALDGRRAEEIAIEEIGPQAGEKVAEELLTAEELGRALETDDMFIVLPQLRELHPDRGGDEYPGARPARAAGSSDAVPAMSRDELLGLLVSCDVIEPA
jgi:FlaA1/EpsC-like NDP-sugar epimerase